MWNAGYDSIVETTMEQMKQNEMMSRRGGVEDRLFETFKIIVGYQFGTLWWGRDDVIKRAHPQFVLRKDRKGHPLVSVMRGELEKPAHSVPMLVGTSGTNLRECIKANCVAVHGVTTGNPNQITYFGSIVKPGMYPYPALLDGVIKKAHTFERGSMRRTPWHELRCMLPNAEKPRLDGQERAALEIFCKKYIKQQV